MTLIQRLTEAVSVAGQPRDLAAARALIDEALKALLSQQEQIDRLHDILTEVKHWIDNWDPDFIHDDEWPGVAEMMREALQHKKAVD